MEPGGDAGRDGYWVRICRECGTVDPEGLPFSDQTPSGPADGSPLAVDPRDLPRWQCSNCGGRAFRSDNWTEGRGPPPGD